MKQFLLLSSIIVIVALFSGCTPRQDRMTENFGRSYETVRFSQIVNPDAGTTALPVEGLDGQAADALVKKYQAGFKKEETPSTVFNLNLGK